MKPNKPVKLDPVSERRDEVVDLGGSRKSQCPARLGRQSRPRISVHRRQAIISCLLPRVHFEWSLLIGESCCPSPRQALTRKAFKWEFRQWGRPSEVLARRRANTSDADAANQAMSRGRERWPSRPCLVSALCHLTWAMRCRLHGRRLKSTAVVCQSELFDARRWLLAPFQRPVNRTDSFKRTAAILSVDQMHGQVGHELVCR